MELKKINENIWEIAKEGKMNVPGRIIANDNLIEQIKSDSTIEQIKNVAAMPGIYKYAIAMPDAHLGYGFPVGGVAAFDTKNGCITPGGVGFDINCGVRLMTTQLLKEDVQPKIKDLLEALFKNISCGVGGESELRLNDDEFNELLNTGLKWALKKGYATKEDVDNCEENGHMKTADHTKVSVKAKARGKKQVGTLGAGNHFVEVQYVTNIYDKDIAKKFGINEENQIMVMVHSGSRGLGHQVCSDFLRKIEEDLPEIFDSLPEKDLAYAPTGSQIAKDYLKAMSCAANFGWCNRQLISHNIRKSFKEVIGTDDLKLVYDVAHNIAKIEKYEIDGEMKEVYVHRKGATRAFGPGHDEIPKIYRDVGQPILIPGSMGTSSYVLVGTDKAMKETFGSTPHGAGRVMSRSQANREFRGEHVKNELEKRKIFIKAASWKGISEEAPEVYKNVDEVVKVADEVGIGKLVCKLVPIGVIKG